MNILLIDDDKDTNFLMDFLLSNLSFVEEYHLKLRASEALDFLAIYQNPLHCIFVDINMPEMNGFQFVEHFEKKFYKKYPSTRIYFLKSSVRERDRQKAMEFMSVKDFILKPLSKDIMQQIHQNLENPPGELE